ncbi:T9SS type A sorting domain-containing protein [Flavobacteriaceae bacterium]|nr:T9SS type A sorting domain-containing protein [Flavobacteriaceae bacterium]
MKKLLLLLSAFMIVFSVDAQQTAIPDPVFEAVLINLGYDNFLDGQVLTANIINVTDLEITYQMTNPQAVFDFTGIEDFTALKNFNCSGHGLTSLDLSNNIALEYLDCRGSSFSNLGSLDLSNNIALETLICPQNEITNLDLSNNSSLIYLDSFGNGLTSLNISNSKFLEFLNTNANNLTSIDLSNNFALEYLNISANNQLGNIDLSNNIALTNANLGGCGLNTLDVSNNVNLESLALSINSLTTLDLSNNTNLISLFVRGNQLTSLDLSNNLALEGLDCWQNQITSLDLSNNSALTRLWCFDNQLTNLDVRNGNNNNIPIGNGSQAGFAAFENPNLTCILVDDADYSNTYWLEIDEIATFGNTVEECEGLNTDDNALELDVTIYPNPTDDYLFIEGNKNPISISIYNLLGAEVIATSATDKINVSKLSKGVYIIRISDGVNQTDKKFIKN